jgi:hypothetical protein
MSNTVTKILPESNGSPRLFTIKTLFTKESIVRGKKQFENSNTAITTILAIIKF